jgi:hypothetical protein
MAKRKEARRKRENGLDRVHAKNHSGLRKSRRGESLAKTYDPYSTKRPRGRPTKILASTVIGRADNYRYGLKQVWEHLEVPLLSAQTIEDVIAAFEKHAQPYASHYAPFQAADILALIRDKHFPKDSDARINFLADSLGGRPSLTFRSSRDVCGRERAKQHAKSPHQIIRHEYYVECSCGYKGPARDNACRKCGAEINMFQEMLWGTGSTGQF